VTRALIPLALVLSLSGCAEYKFGYAVMGADGYIATSAVAAAGVADVMLDRGCFGVWASNKLPWHRRAPYVCRPAAPGEEPARAFQ